MVAIAFAGASAVREITNDDAETGSAATHIERVSSKRIDGDRREVTFEGVGPGTWRIRYRVSGPGSVVTEDVVVRAPFESHTDVRIDGEFSEVREAALGISVTKPVRATAVGLAPAPEAAGFRPGPVIEDAAGDGLLVEREQRTVAGRTCNVYRTSSEFGGATFAPPTSDTDYVDVCVDGDGLLLELIEVFEGKFIRQRVALSVDTGIEVSDAELNDLAHEPTIPANQGGGSVRPIDPTSQPVGPFFVLDAAPAGYTHLGRYEVVPPQPDIARPEARGKVVAAVSDVFTSGGSTIVLERGGRLDKAAPWNVDDRFPDVDLGPALGQGEFLAGITGGEVRVLLDAGRFVRVYGTAGRDELVAVAKALRPTDAGTGPVYLAD